MRLAYWVGALYALKALQCKAFGVLSLKKTKRNTKFQTAQISTAKSLIFQIWAPVSQIHEIMIETHGLFMDPRKIFMAFAWITPPSYMASCFSMSYVGALCYRTQCKRLLPAKCCFRWIIFPIQFLLFQWCKERLGYSIIVSLSRIGKGLYTSLFMKELLKAMRCILCAAVTVKNESRFWLAQFTRHLEGGRDELCAVFPGDLVGDDHMGKQIQILQFFYFSL